MDDIFFIWTHGEEKLTQFLNEFYNFHFYLKFTYETSSGTFNFVNLSLRNGAIHTDLYIKPTDSHLYLHYQYSHPLYIKTSIPYSQALISHMEQWFLAKGYSEIVVNNQIDKVVFVREQSVKKNLESGIPFITTYHPKVKELRKLIRDLLPFLYSDGEVQKVFSPPPIVSYRSARKIRDCIVRSKLYLVERKVGCRRCGSSRCEVCKSISFCKVIFYSVITKLFLKTRFG